MVGENKKNATTLASTHLEQEPEQETIRVRIWRVLVASYGEELSLQQLQKLVAGGGNGVNRQTLRDHLTHVGRQAKTLQNKKTQWKARRGFYDQATAATANDQDTNQPEPQPARRLPRRMDKIRLHLRRGSSSSSSSHDGNSGGGTKGGRRSGTKKRRNTTIYVKLEWNGTRRKGKKKYNRNEKKDWIIAGHFSNWKKQRHNPDMDLHQIITRIADFDCSLAAGKRGRVQDRK